LIFIKEEELKHVTVVKVANLGSTALPFLLDPAPLTIQIRIDSGEN